MPRTQFVGLVLAPFVWPAICSVLLYPPLDEFFIGRVFSWLPGWFFFAEDFARYSTAALFTTWVFGLVVNGVAGPLVEEVYFRGYLLPRISGSDESRRKHLVLVQVKLLDTLRSRNGFRNA